MSCVAKAPPVFSNCVLTTPPQVMILPPIPPCQVMILPSQWSLLLPPAAWTYFIMCLLGLTLDDTGLRPNHIAVVVHEGGGAQMYYHTAGKEEVGGTRSAVPNARAGCKAPVSFSS